MERTTNVVYNFIVQGVLFYAVGRLLGGHRTGLRFGLVGGTLSAAVTWVVYARLAASGELDRLRREAEGR